MATGPTRPGSVPDRWRTAFFPRRGTLRRCSDRWKTASRWGAVVLILLIPLVSAVGGAVRRLSGTRRSRCA